MKKAVITVVGKDATGIIYRVTGVLFHRSANVLDITQTIMQEMFTMIMLVDISMLNISFDQLVQELNQLGAEHALSIHCQHEDIFKSMHTI